MTGQPARGVLLPPLKSTVTALTAEFGRIAPRRKTALDELTDFIIERLRAGETAKLNFICTHNSRRSHMAHLWAQAAAYYYEVDDVLCFSGGTRATAFHPHAAEALGNAGFDIRQMSEGDNPRYDVRFSNDAPVVKVFSKEYRDAANPARGFAAIMTCSDADQNCPLVTGALKRIAITYDDPKEFDGTAQEQTAYRDRALQIGREMLFAFYSVAGKI